MITLARLNFVQRLPEGIRLDLIAKDDSIFDFVIDKEVREAEVRLDDGRQISVQQRKKAYATIRDISDYTGYMPEEQKEWLKYLHIAKTGCRYFSLSDCSMDTAREYINTMLDYVLMMGIPLSERGIERTDDIERYLYYCLKYRRCAVCGGDGEIHHVDAIGMGNDRRTVDDTQYRKICLCRLHHTQAHQRGMQQFEAIYHVYGILYNEGGGGNEYRGFDPGREPKRHQPDSAPDSGRDNRPGDAQYDP